MSDIFFNPVWDIRMTDTSLRDGSHHKRHQFSTDEVRSIVARVWPALTCWPTCTGTVATVPATAKAASATRAAASVPSASTTWLTSRVVAVASR